MTPLDGREETDKRVRMDAELGDIIDHFMDDQTPVTVITPDHEVVGRISIKDALAALRG